jgi:NAD(P)-dependent dehydrogenase (short-subunit alcohol dehydrogenase family)
MSGPEGQNQYKGAVGAIITGISDLFKKPEAALELTESHRLDGKKVLITGSSSGLGLAAAEELARRGAEVIMAVRSGIPGKGERVKQRSGSRLVHMIPIDLSQPEAIRAFPEQCMERFGPIDILISNAAMVAGSSRKTKEGLDEMFMVNYFAKFLLVRGMVENGCFRSDGPDLPRIIFVTSESHRNPEDFHWDDFGRYVPYTIKKAVYMYGYYKLLLVTLANEFSRRLNPDGDLRYVVSALCPGPVNSNIAREAPRIFHPLLKLVFGIFFRSPAKACGPVIYLATSPENNGMPMDYLFLMQRKAMDPKATNEAHGQKLWELSLELEKNIDK